MWSISLELENVTPLFIAGADQRSIENEGLRVPSLRGLLRWWFRAIMGGMTNVQDLKTLEDNVFGAPQQKSAVKILSTTKGKPSRIDIPSNQDLRYLWFSIHMQRRKNQRLQYYPPKTKFDVRLNSYDENRLKIVLGCLWALIYLGGVGARMRRGAGSLKVNTVSDKSPYEFTFEGDTVNDAKNFIERNIAEIFESFKKYAGEKYSPQKNPNFAVLSKNHANISLIKQPSNSWEEVLSRISGVYQQFRRRKRLEDRYIFGLPITARSEFKDLRHASPLFIGVMDLNGKYTVRLVKFYTSIHKDFYSNIKLLRENLNGLDDMIVKSSGFGEVEVQIPEV